MLVIVFGVQYSAVQHSAFLRAASRAAKGPVSVS